MGKKSNMRSIRRSALNISWFNLLKSQTLTKIPMSYTHHETDLLYQTVTSKIYKRSPYIFTAKTEICIRNGIIH